MSKDFDEQLAAAKAKPREYKDIPVILDSEIAAERERLLDELENAQKLDAADQRLAGPQDINAAPIIERLEALTEAAQDSVVNVRVKKLPGDEWAIITSLHPVRAGVAIDMHYGYNYDAVCVAAATHTSENGDVYAFRVDGDEEIPMTPEQWRSLFSVISGAEASELRDAIWSLNEYEPTKRRNILVKGFGAAARSDKK